MAPRTFYYSSVVSNLPRVKSRGFLQLRVKMENSSDQEQDGKDKSVKSSSLIGSLMPRRLKEAQEMMIFALDHSHNKHKGHIKDCQLGNPCEFNCDPRAIINPPIIKRTYGHDLEERVEQAKG
ncbi:hypothetical protein Tco_1452726 [Tanacetum coccineum]